MAHPDGDRRPPLTDLFAKLEGQDEFNDALRTAHRATLLDTATTDDDMSAAMRATRAGRAWTEIEPPFNRQEATR